MLRSSGDFENKFDRAISLSRPSIIKDTLGEDDFCEGWLEKQQPNMLKRWQKRYFVLRDGSLEYFRKAEDPKPSGALDLAVCSAAAHPESKRDFCIRLETSERPYHLAAENGDDMSSWLLALQGNCRGEFGDTSHKATFK